MRFPQRAPLFLRFVALYGIDLAQPIYDLVGRSPEFLERPGAARRAGWVRAVGRDRTASSFEPGANHVEAFVVRAAADGSVRLEV